jgi:hypothetical protein
MSSRTSISLKATDRRAVDREAVERSGEGRGGPVELYAGQPVQAEELDQSPDLGLGAAQEDGAAVGTQTPGQHGQVEHQRRVGEDQSREVDDDVGLRANRARESPATDSLRTPVLVALAA